MTPRSRLQQLKKHLIIVLSLGIMALTWQNLQAQESKKEIRLQIEKTINGETVMVDTSFTLDAPQDVEAILKTLDPEAEVDIEWTSDEGVDREITVEKIIGGGEEGEHEMKVMRKSGGGTWTTDDGSTVDLEQKGKRIMFIEDAENMTEEDVANLLKQYEDGELGEVMKEVMVNVEKNMDGETGETIQIKVVTRHCRIEDCGREDLAKLLRTGKKREVFDSGLAVEDLSFYPNPNDGKFRLQFSSPQEGQLDVAVRDLMGKTIYTEVQSSFSGSYDNMINLSETAAGVYFLTIMHKNQALTKKIVIEQ